MPVVALDGGSGEPSALEPEGLAEIAGGSAAATVRGEPAPVPIEPGTRHWTSDEAAARGNNLVDLYVQAEARRRGTAPSSYSARAAAIGLYADYLARYERLPLDESSYRTLDSFFFFWYPRKVMQASPASAVQLLAALSGFYRFLAERGFVASDDNVQHINERKEQLVAKLGLYARLEPDSPLWDRLFQKLFAEER